MEIGGLGDYGQRVEKDWSWKMLGGNWTRMCLLAESAADLVRLL